jgi:hypothetical protein
LPAKSNTAMMNSCSGTVTASRSGNCAKRHPDALAGSFE